MQLQSGLAGLKARGLSLVAISYDSPETLREFAAQRGISFPLLSDTGSATIKAYGILNSAATGRTAGIPHPGTFIVDRRGVVVSRSFEERYQERATAGSLSDSVTPAGPRSATTHETAHLTLATSASDAVVTPGSRFSLYVDVVPRRRMHVYAPDEKRYQQISVTLKEDESIRLQAARFPPSERFFFAPLNETQLVYSKPFRVVQDMTIPVTSATRQRAAADGAQLDLTGVVRYQACDDKVCYVPQEVPVSWTLRLKPLER